MPDVSRCQSGMSRHHNARDLSVTHVYGLPHFPSCRGQQCCCSRRSAVEIQYTVFQIFVQHLVKGRFKRLSPPAWGSNARPKRVSNKVMLVIQTDSAGCRSSHATTAGSGPACINALITLVSRIITAYRISPVGKPDRATPGAPQSDPLWQNVPQCVTPTLRRGAHRSSRHRARCDGLLLPYCGRDAQRGASDALSRPLPDDAQRPGPFSPISRYHYWARVNYHGGLYFLPIALYSPIFLPSQSFGLRPQQPFRVPSRIC